MAHWRENFDARPIRDNMGFHVRDHSSRVHTVRRKSRAIDRKGHPMKRLLSSAAMLLLATGAASAQGWGRPAADHHADWRKGGHIGHDDWNRGQRVDYHALHLAAPQGGYEWRRVDNNYILAAATTGLIASIVVVKP
jgi:Ni/Co efflux regulator RcnB